MNPIKKLYCRTFQSVFKIAIPLLPYRSPELLHGMEELVGKLNELQLASVLLVTDAGIRGLGLTKHLEELLSENNIDLQPRFDVVEVTTFKNKESQIIHFENAFDIGECDEIF